MKYIRTVFDDRNRPSYELRKVEVKSDTVDTNWDEGDKLVDYFFVTGQMRTLLGKVLTVVDASITGQQNKAIKDIIKGIFVYEYTELSSMLLDKKEMDDACTFDESNPDDVERLRQMEEITEDEALGLTK